MHNREFNRMQYMHGSVCSTRDINGKPISVGRRNRKIAGNKNIFHGVKMLMESKLTRKPHPTVESGHNET